MTALSEINSAVAETPFWVPQAPSGTTSAGNLVLTCASSNLKRTLLSLVALLAMLLSRRFLSTAHVGVHRGDVKVPAIMDSIERVVVGLARSHQPSRYAVSPESEQCGS